MIETAPGDAAKVGPPVKILTGWRTLLPLFPYRSSRGWRIRVFPGKLALWIVCFAAFSYLGGGFALFLNDRYRHRLDGISLTDRLYPPRWDRYRAARGDSLIRNGRAALDQGDVATAVHLLRTGLARSPANVDGRVLLSDIFIFAKRGDLAETMLLAGLEPGVFDPSNVDYLNRTLLFLFQRQRDEAVIQLSQQLANNFQFDAATQANLAMARANAHFFRGNFDQAEQTLRDFDLQTRPEGRILSARIEWERGFPELGLVLIEQLAHELPNHPEIYRLRIEWLLTTGKTDRARQISLLRRIEQPDELRPRIDFLKALHEASDAAAVLAESEALLLHFSTQPDAYLLLGDFAANSGNPEIAKLAFDAAARQGIQTGGLALMRVESLIVAQRYRDAIALSHELLQDNPDWETSLAPVFNGLQAIAHFAMGDREAADLYLNDFLEQRNLRAENLVAVSNRLSSVGADQQAHLVLQRAVQTDPQNQPALSALVEFELRTPESPALGQHLAQLLEMRRPSPKLLRHAYRTLGQDRFIFLANREQLLNALKRSLAGGRQAVST